MPLKKAINSYYRNLINDTRLHQWTGFFPPSQHFMQPSGAFKTHLDILFLRITFEGITQWPHSHYEMSGPGSPTIAHIRAGDNEMRKLMVISKLWEKCPAPVLGPIRHTVISGHCCPLGGGDNSEED